MQAAWSQNQSWKEKKRKEQSGNHNGLQKTLRRDRKGKKNPKFFQVVCVEQK
jgi:hypothetical protein